MLFKKIKIRVKAFFLRFLGIENNEQYIQKLQKRGLIVGANFNMQKDVILDDTHCWLIKIGNNVTMAPRVHVLCHDASTKHFLNYTRIGLVQIGNNVFIGANSVIMPSVIIGNNVIIAAGSVVTKNIEEGTIVAGVPAKKIGITKDYILENKENLNNSFTYDESYTMRKKISQKKKHKMITEMESSKHKQAYII
ncbi:acyltransferase [Xanthomarina gelatinilytica]|uniref:acyltransferase n=1 Tax=Xanthomarina gelatinilytica TaxID=1137281 RepID=UPI003AA89651